MPITGSTVQLRVPTAEDAVAWHRLFDDPDVMEFHGGTSHDLAHYEEFTARQRAHHEHLGICLYTLLNGTGEVIGFTGAQPWPHEWGPRGEIEIGWRLGRAFWGQGYATLAAETTLERVRAVGIRHVVAMVAERNERSIAVTRRVGMKESETFVSPVSKTRAACFRLDL
ncbi:GNAT family N-acetyltransferase [Streptomyces zagrosensis]|uniref:RimJ/RimL family protein N-acetyltransferase n=1 Tax=Streptomyces zagrosensis TaxID=1042984 RepID=A0A7W9QDN5_9ACTN|nr:GNAT family N-acetyltransferase [Streptomyces zagrosensis]MBB5938049.1 RimJ/RimL family protein N-acetyltransferase [Streptomyces zagrosensis]